MTTASPRSCGKVMVADLSVCHSVQGGPHCTELNSKWPLPQSMFKLDQLGPNCTETTYRHVQTCSLWSIYGTQARGWHPSGMLSSLLKVRSRFSCGSHFVQLKWTLDNQNAFRFAHRRSWIKSCIPFEDKSHWSSGTQPLISSPAYVSADNSVMWSILDLLQREMVAQAEITTLR